MAASRRHAQLVLLLLLDLSFFCTFARCTVLTFDRNENSITLRCLSDLQNQFEIINANFFVRTPDSSRQPVRDVIPTMVTRSRTNEIMFTLTPETEGNFSCQNPTTNQFSEELLLSGELPWVILSNLENCHRGVSPTLSTPISPTKKIKLCHFAYSNKNNFFLLTTIDFFFCFTEKLILGGMRIITRGGCSLIYRRIPRGNSNKC